MSGQEKPKILIVDDIAVNLILLETVLRKENATLLKSLTGKEALEISAINDLALIILDVSMPGMNGFELAEHIRNQEKHALTPIIFVSAILYDQLSIIKGYKAGAVDYITKPYENEVLLGKVRMFLKIHQQNREIKRTSEALQESVSRYKKVEDTLLFRYSLEKIISLASARFSGRFDLEQSLQFMLMDLAQLLDARDVSFFTVDNTNPGKVLSSSGLKNISLPQPKKSFIDSLFSLTDSCNVLVHYITPENKWHRPENNLQANDNEIGMAIPVYLQDKPYGCILIKGCPDFNLLDSQDICSLGVFGTITGNAIERIFTQLKLEKSELKYRSYIENAPNGILVSDAKGNISESNTAATILFGLDHAKLNKHNLDELLDKEKLSAQFAEFNGLLTDKKSQAEFFVSKGGSTLIVRAESVLLPDGKFLIFCSDITATREMEKHLIHTERMVGIGEMATGIAHEINQPLNIISFGMDNLIHAISTKKADDEYIKEKSRKIFEGIHRMRTIIDHVRTFSRSNDDFIHSAFSLNESINNALSLVNEQYKNRGIQVATHLAPDTQVSIVGNTYKIEQVILNLLSNARDAIEEKLEETDKDFTPQITVNSAKDGDNIIVEVIDNGNGIAPEHLEHLTAPFYTTKEPGKGTGLGLAITYGIIKEHKGEVTFTTMPDKQTKVTLKFGPTTAPISK